MKRLLTILLFFAACTSNKPEVPKNILPPQKMQAIMLDLIIVDGRIANSLPSDSLMRQNKSRYRMYQQVLALHGTDKEKFNQSLRFYEQHPPLLQEVIDSMEQNLDRQLSDTTRRKAPEQPKPI